MGAVLLAAGVVGQRKAMPNARVMIHEASRSTSKLQISDFELRYEELKKKKVKTYRKKVDKLTDKDKTEAVNAYYQSGRKLNCTELTPHILRQVLDEKGVKEKKSNPIRSVYVVRLMDSILSDEEIDPQLNILQVQRLLVGLTGDDPVAWKGQLFDMMLDGTLSQNSARLYSRAIDRVARFIGYEDD